MPDRNAARECFKAHDCDISESTQSKMFELIERMPASANKNLIFMVEDVVQEESKFKLDNYTIGLISVLLVQIVFCIGICCWTSKKVKTSQNENVRQQAEFYQFLWQFHKLMRDEEAALQEHYSKPGNLMVATPGGAQDDFKKK